jgi:hypothetical protein
MAERSPGVIPAGRVALPAKRRREWRLQAHLAAAAGSGQVGTRPSRGVSPGSSASTVRSSPGYRSAVSGHRSVVSVTVRLPRLPFSRLRSSFGCLGYRPVAPVTVQSSAVIVRLSRLPSGCSGCRSVVCGHRSVVSVSVRSPRLPFSRLRSPFDRPGYRFDRPGYRFDRSGYCSVVSGYAVTVSWPSTDAVRSVPCALSARRPGIPSPRYKYLLLFDRSPECDFAHTLRGRRCRTDRRTADRRRQTAAQAAQCLIRSVKYRLFLPPAFF